MKPYHGPSTAYIPEKWRDDVSQTEYDDFRLAHGLKWLDITHATPHELAMIRAERTEG